ncbi:putative MFS family transporter protein [Pannonibacter phragmitetus]|uniref:Putative MFS family transporter protein n=1 Tax=Pannonibacter phragmitetus TaxID=121719 RepID=A0A378ZT93_9HYPH|nr:YbfB/YjiJ family MFS transporter [Pannonibacter phragmitetus]SUB00223.1 putative MFS family transporter protein [Pannonibacter phragmitetus]
MTSAAPSTASPVHLALGGLLSLAAAMGIGRFVYTPVLPFMIAQVPLSKADGGLIASANFLGYLLGALAASSGSLPGGRRVWFLGSLIASSALSFAMAWTDSVPAFMLLRFLAGLASAFAFVFSATLILDRLAQAGRPGLSALYFSGVGAGIAGSALIVSGLAAMGADWQGLWTGCGVISLALTAIIAWMVPGAPDTAPAAPAKTGPRRLPAGLPQLIAAYGLFGIGYVVTATFIAVIARSDPALATAEPYLWLIVGLAAAPSIFIWNRIAARTGVPRAYALACVIEACGVALSVTAAGPAGILLAAFLLGATFMGITALGLIEARRLSTGDPRRTIALMTASFGLGQMLGPSLAGFAAGSTGSFALPSAGAALCLLLAAGLVLIPARQQ